MAGQTRKYRSKMVTEQQIIELMKQYFPLCPVCKSNYGYDASARKRYVQCKKCDVKFESKDFKKCKELKELKVLEASSDGRLFQLREKRYPISFWKSLSNDRIDRSRPWGNSIAPQENEIFLRWNKAQEIFEDKTQALGVRVGNKGCLVLTDQRLLFTAKLGFLAKEFGVIYGIDLGDVMSISPGRFGFNKKLVVLNKNGTHRDFLDPSILGLIPEINKAIVNRKQAIKAEKARERVQVVLDFTSLREVISKGGLVLQSFKCPNCSGMLEIPESGKILMCKYCGTPLKPIDILEKIKSFIDVS